MASVFGHAITAYTITKLVSNHTSKTLIFLAIGSAILPDIDVLAFNFGIPYTHPLGHRGFTHSILFALLWSGLLALLFGKNKKNLFLIILFLATLSHGMLDALTTGGKGVGFFIPWGNERYFFPYRFIKVSPIGIDKFFSSWGMQVVLSELKYIILPCSLILISLHFKKKLKKWI